MDIRKLQRAIVDGLEDVKAHDIVVFNTEHLSPLFERVIVASGTSNRQTRALANSVRETVKARGLPVLSMEGEDNGEWIIVDCGAAVAHIMQPAIRDYYRLEELWGSKPVRMKMDGEVRPTAEAAARPAAARTRERTLPPPGTAATGAGRRAAPGTRPGAAKKTATAKPAPRAHKSAAKRASRAR